MKKLKQPVFPSIDIRPDRKCKEYFLYSDCAASIPCIGVLNADFFIFSSVCDTLSSTPLDSGAQINCGLIIEEALFCSYCALSNMLSVFICFLCFLIILLELYFFLCYSWYLPNP